MAATDVLGKMKDIGEFLKVSADREMNFAQLHNLAGDSTAAAFHHGQAMAYLLAARLVGMTLKATEDEAKTKAS